MSFSYLNSPALSKNMSSSTRSPAGDTQRARIMPNDPRYPRCCGNLLAAPGCRQGVGLDRESLGRFDGFPDSGEHYFEDVCHFRYFVLLVGFATGGGRGPADFRGDGGQETGNKKPLRLAGVRFSIRRCVVRSTNAATRTTGNPCGRTGTHTGAGLCACSGGVVGAE